MHQENLLPEFKATTSNLVIAVFCDSYQSINVVELPLNCGFLYVCDANFCSHPIFTRSTVPLLHKIASWANTEDPWSVSKFSYIYYNCFTNYKVVGNNCASIGFKTIGKPVLNKRSGNKVQCYRAYIPTLLKLTKTD